MIHRPPYWPDFMIRNEIENKIRYVSIDTMVRVSHKGYWYRVLVSEKYVQDTLVETDPFEVAMRHLCINVHQIQTVGVYNPSLIPGLNFPAWELDTDQRSEEERITQILSYFK